MPKQVARSEAQKQPTTGDRDEDCGDDIGVKFQTEWLPVEDSVPEFFAHLVGALEAYMPHAYEIKLSDRVDKCAERAFLIDPAANPACPDEFKGVVMEVVDFSSDIHAKREHDVTCTFPESHKCEVHHLTFAPKFISVDAIAIDHPRSADTLRKRKIDRVLRAENVVVYAFSKAKASAAYNQYSTTNIMSIIKHGKLPDDSKCEAFLDGRRIPGGVRDGFPDLPQDKLSEWVTCSPLYPNIQRYR